MSFKLQFGEEVYRIVTTDSDEGDAVEYGELAEIEVGQDRYIALVAMNNQDECESVLGEEWVYRAEPIKATTEEVDFDFEDGGEEE